MSCSPIHLILMSLCLLLTSFCALAGAGTVTPEALATKTEPGKQHEPPDPRLARLEHLVRSSGVSAQLAILSGYVREETANKFLLCGDTLAAGPDETPLPGTRMEVLENLLAGHSLVDDLIGQLDRKLDPFTVEGALRWYGSATGKRISQIEADSADLDAAEFEQISTEYLESGQWTKERSQSISTVLSATRTVEFVTAMNTGTLALATLAATCVPDDLEERSRQLNQSQKLSGSFDWQDEFVGVVIKSDLVSLSGTLFRELTTLELERYSEFAGSMQGKQFFEAVTDSIVALLKARVELLDKELVRELAQARESGSGTLLPLRVENEAD